MRTQSTPYYGGNTPVYGSPNLHPAAHYPRGGGQFVPAFLGDVPAPGHSLGAADVSTSLPMIGYTAASLTGAALGGGLVGYIASHNGKGAVTGAAFTAGVAGISDAVTLGVQGNTGMAAAVGLAGLGALSWAIYRFRHSR